MDLSAKIKDNGPLRVMLWSHPRSLSTVFEKCINFVPNTQIINEPFSCACMMGPEQLPTPEEFISPGKEEAYYKSLDEIKMDLPMAFESDDCTFAFVKQILEADYEGKKLVFCKDMAFALDARYDMIPQGFRHTFVMRHPYRMLPSFRKLLVPFLEDEGHGDFRMNDLPASIMPAGYGFQEQYELIMHLRDSGEEPDPIVIDADDLLQNPSSIMRQYCTLLGIPFSEDLLEWPASRDCIKSWKGSRQIILGNFHEWGGYYETALSCSRFHPLKPLPRREDLADDVGECADASMPFYEKMRELRLKP